MTNNQSTNSKIPEPPSTTDGAQDAAPENPAPRRHGKNMPAKVLALMDFAVAGKPVKTDDVLQIPQDLSETDAVTLLKMGRVEPIAE